MARRNCPSGRQQQLGRCWHTHRDRAAAARERSAPRHRDAVHLVPNAFGGTDLDVAGATIPGAPFVVIGHNATIAWGLTNTGADVQDFYVEDVDFKSRRYLYDNQWLPLEVQVANIGVRGRDKPEVYRIFKTRHGPLVATESQWKSRRCSPRRMDIRQTGRSPCDGTR